LNTAVLLAGAMLVLLLVVALVREIRLRRALQALLRRLLTLWRDHAQRKNRPPEQSRGEDAARAGDRL
jgi:hypothetical protein